MFFVEQEDPEEIRRRHVRTGVWLDAPEGGLTLVERDGTRYQVRRVGERWRLSCGRAGAIQHTRGYEDWEAGTREACLEMAAFMRRVAKLHSAWCDRKVAPVERPSHLPGIVLSARKEGGTVHARATESATGDVVGTFYAAYTGWRGSWVLGEETVSTSSQVVPELVGTGLGRALYDLVEEVAGLPLVPHGVNHVGGGRTDHSRRFWERRATHVRVPGLGDPAVEARDAAMTAVADALATEARRFDPELAVAVASRTGLPVEVLLARTELGPRPTCAWCLTPDGRAITTWGFEDRDALAAQAAALSGPDTGAPVTTDAEGLSRMLGDYTGRLCLEPPEPHVPNDRDARTAAAIIARYALDDLVPARPGATRVASGRPPQEDGTMDIEDDADDEVPVAERVRAVIDGVKAFAAGRPIAVELRPYLNLHTDQIQGVVLTDLFADRPGNGAGSAVVRELLRLADAADVSVYTDAQGPPSAAFYVKMGFEPSRGRGHQFAHHPPLPAYLLRDEDDEHATLPGPH